MCRLHLISTRLLVISARWWKIARFARRTGTLLAVKKRCIMLSPGPIHTLRCRLRRRHYQNVQITCVRKTLNTIHWCTQLIFYHTEVMCIRVKSLASRHARTTLLSRRYNAVNEYVQPFSVYALLYKGRYVSQSRPGSGWHTCRNIAWSEACQVDATVSKRRFSTDQQWFRLTSGCNYFMTCWHLASKPHALRTGPCFSLTDCLTLIAPVDGRRRICQD